MSNILDVTYDTTGATKGGIMLLTSCCGFSAYYFTMSCLCRDSGLVIEREEKHVLILLSSAEMF